MATLIQVIAKLSEIVKELDKLGASISMAQKLFDGTEGREFNRPFSIKGESLMSKIFTSLCRIHEQLAFVETQHFRLINSINGSTPVPEVTANDEVEIAHLIEAELQEG